MILPPRCVISGEIVGAEGALSPGAWASLRFISAPFCEGCSLPFEFESGPGTRCGECLASPFPFTRTRAALVYDDASRDMVLKFKHADQLHAVPTLVPMMLRAGADVIADADIVVPVPLHRQRLLRRRYNQAALLANNIAKASGKTSVPDAMIRTRKTLPQGHKKARSRAENVRNAFMFDPRYKNLIRGKNILLVDDVFTTGSTLAECAKTLINAEAARVDALVVARVLKDK